MLFASALPSACIMKARGLAEMHSNAKVKMHKSLLEDRHTSV